MHHEKLIRREGSYVKIRYSLSTDKGDIVKGNPREGPAILEFFTGYEQVLPALEKILVGKKEKEALRVSIPPEEAFGLYEPEQVKEKRYEEFPQGRHLQEGKWVLARDDTTRASYAYFVKEKNDQRLLLDYNHPLAGRTLIYELEIVEVRDATPEERELLRPCESRGGPPVSASDCSSRDGELHVMDTEE